LKIDRSFVSQLGGQSRDREIIAGVTGMAHAVGMTVVAEGVETEAQRDELTAIGCDAAQGLHIRPAADPRMHSPRCGTRRHTQTAPNSVPTHATGIGNRSPPGATSSGAPAGAVRDTVVTTLDNDRYVKLPAN
jgi:EAL domain-containing protein (putative c-di-GMP-specific phosphodiesterase class I)